MSGLLDFIITVCPLLSIRSHSKTNPCTRKSIWKFSPSVLWYTACPSTVYMFHRTPEIILNTQKLSRVDSDGEDNEMDVHHDAVMDVVGYYTFTDDSDTSADEPL